MEQSEEIRLLEHQHKAVAEKIYAVFQRAYQIEADLLGVTDFPPLSRTVKDIAHSTRRFYGVYREQELAAVVEIEFITDGLDICSLVVDPTFFRQGLAWCLLQYVLTSFQGQFALVETAAGNQPAIALYKKCGFTVVETWLPAHGILKVRLRAEL